MSKFKYFLPSLLFIYLFLVYTFKTNALPYMYKKLYMDKRKLPPCLLEKAKKEEVEGEFFNRCVYMNIPKVTGQLETAQYLRYTNTSLIRFGDGEILAILKKDIPKEKYDPELSRRMYECFTTKDKRISLGLPNVFSDCPFYTKGVYGTWRRLFPDLVQWMYDNADYSRQYFDTFITSPFTTTYNTSCELVDLVYENLRAIWKDKDVIIMRGDNGEVYEYDVYDTAKTQKTLYAPATGSWLKYKELKEALMKEDPNSIYILSVGHLSKILVYDLVMANRRALDMGHLAKDYNCYKKNEYMTYFYAI